MKRLLSVIIAGTLAFLAMPFQITDVKAEEHEISSIWDGTDDIFWYQEGKTEFSISTAEELSGFAKLVNRGIDFEGLTVTLENDIYLNDTSNLDEWKENPPANKWTSIGNYYVSMTSMIDTPFRGTFDGQSHGIYGLYQDNQPMTGNSDWLSKYQYHGLFGFVQEGAEVKNLIVDDGLIQGVVYTGGIIGYACNNVIIENCMNGCEIVSYNDLASSEIQGKCSSGGITGHGGIISYCLNNGNVSIENATALRYGNNSIECLAYAGGISGGGFESISCSCNYGDIQAVCILSTGSNIQENLVAAAGGIGGVSYSDISNCHNRGNISCLGRYCHTGGICGEIYGKELKVINCLNVGDVSFVEDEGVFYKGIGGLVGYDFDSNLGAIQNSYFLNTTSTKCVGNLSNETFPVLNESALKKKEFSSTLGEAFIYVEGDYPKLAWELGVENLKGDINADGEVTVADVILLQKYLLNAYSYSLAEWERSDIYEDGDVDVIDLAMLKRILINRN